MDTSIISARGLSKSFPAKGEPVAAVTDLDLDVAPGELVAFLGPNGAGKSTSIRMLTTLLPPTSGAATVCGYDIARQQAAVRASIGYIGQGNSAGHNQRVRDELLSQGAFYGMDRRRTAARADELLESLGLSALARRGVMGLSGGQRRRLDIALGLIHAPRLLFLDEPSTGLDPQSRANLWQHILDLRREHGTTIFVTTHYLEEADQFAERVMVMDHGRVIADDTAARLKADLAGDEVVLGFASAEEAALARPVLTRVSGRTPAAIAPHGLRVVVEDGEALAPRLVQELAAAGVSPARLGLRRPTLDDVFLALTGRSLRESGTAGTDPGADPVGPADSTAPGGASDTPDQTEMEIAR